MTKNVNVNRIFAVLLTTIVLFSAIVIISACNTQTVNPHENFPPLYGEETGLIELPGRDEIIPVESVEIRIANPVIQRGAVINPRVIIYPRNATDQSYTIYTYDTSILRKTYDGGFLAIDSGKAEIIVLAANGVTEWIEVTVIVPVRRITFNETEITLNVGENMRLIPDIFPSDASVGHISYQSSYPQVATVSSGGIVRAVSVGTTEITCIVDGIAEVVTIHVVIPVTSISLTTDREVYAVGNRGTFNVELIPENATDQSFEVSFSQGVEMTGAQSFLVTDEGDIVITVTTPSGLTATQTIIAIDLDALADSIFDLTNRERRQANLPVLARRRALTRAAGTRAVELISYYSHTRPDGRNNFTILIEHNVTYNVAFENIGRGRETAAEIIEDIMADRDAQNNILNTNIRHIGIGVTMDDDGTIYWVQIFSG